MPAPKVFQWLYFPDTPSPISGRFSINLSLLFCKSTVFSSQRLLHLPVKSVHAGPKGFKLLSEAAGDRRVCAVEGVIVHREPRTSATPSPRSEGSKEQLSEENVEIKQICLMKKKVKNTLGQGCLPCSWKAVPAPAASTSIRPWVQRQSQGAWVARGNSTEMEEMVQS